MPISRINTNSIANNTIQGADLLDASITAAKIISVANTQITGNIASSQITSVANTQLTGTITGSQISSNTLSNTVFQTGSVENYFNAAGSMFQYKNYIINGAMQVAQRGTTSASTGYQTVDRWKVNNCTNQAQLTDAPTGFSNSLEITGTVVGSSGYGLVDHYIETKNIISANGSSVILSAWVKNTGTSTVNVSCEVYSATAVDNFASVTLVSSLTSQTITTGWTRIVFPAFTVSSAAATNGLNLRIFRYDGSNSQKWQITGVQLERGTTVTSFDYRPFGTELALCQRYYWQELTLFASGIAFDTVEAQVRVQYPVQMRISPTVTIYDNSNNAARIHRNRVGDHGNAVTIVNSTHIGFPTISSSSLTAGGGYSCKVKADAEL